MKEYITVIVGAALLSVFADIVSPEQWRKYIKIITGLVIISVIIAPVAKMRNIDLSFDVDDNFTIEETGSQKKLVADELRRLVQNDAKQKIKEKYGLDADVKASIKLNENMEIERVEKMIVYIDNPPETLKAYIAEIYGLKDEEVIFE
ncbi:MAG: stage III sporulation protein AF [Clostridia bacterium]|nr:stage III sporulation protein AF [Clostridia bacterium]